MLAASKVWLYLVLFILIKSNYMKKILFTFLSVNGFCLLAFAQNSGNVGIGTTTPVTSLHVAGNFLVSEPPINSNTPPAPAQTTTMINGSTFSFLADDSIGRIYDPGGAAGNYLPNMQCDVSMLPGSNIGISLIFEQLELGT